MSKKFQDARKKGLTLMEIMIAMFVLGILVTVVIPTYLRVTEKSRAAEAINILGLLRRAEEAYYNKHLVFATTPDDLNIPVPEWPCNRSFYFYYYVGLYDTLGASATRCQVGGKYPNSGVAYTIRLNPDGTWYYTHPEYQ